MAKKRGKKGGGGGGGGDKAGGKPPSAADAKKKSGEGKAGQYVGRLDRVTKVLPGGRILFNDVSLNLLAGAKVGVLGPNGAGKSSLLKIFAGFDGDHDGTAWRPNGLRVGMLEQEPVLDEERCGITYICYIYCALLVFSSVGFVHNLSRICRPEARLSRAANGGGRHRLPSNLLESGSGNPANP